MSTTRTNDPPLNPPGPLFRLVGGKGGVGKTTCAAALAVTAARSGARTLVISTDPAPSLGDALGRPLGASPKRVPLGRGSLHGVEIDASRALERWLSGRREILERIAVRGTWLDEDDVARLLRLSLPGIDEIAALLEVMRLGHSGRFDLVVVDTAPTGHTLRMLTLPEMLRRVARLFDAMQEKHRMMVAALRGGWKPEAEDELVMELDRDGEALSALLRDPARLTATWVTLPEPMAVEETLDGIRVLQESGIEVARIIVNRLTLRPPSACRRCDARRAFEEGATKSLVDRVGDVPVIGLEAREKEPHSLGALASIGAEIESGKAVRPRARRRAPQWRDGFEGDRAPFGAADLADAETRLLMFGGKGGVGKTTCACASAIEIAVRFPGRRVLLLSTDPAHSAGDALGVELGDLPRVAAGGPANLAARELDAAERFQAVRAKYAAAVEAMLDRLSRGSSAAAGHEAAVMRDLMELAPPGIDELASVAEVTGALAGALGDHRFDLVVMDMAPSGHALRLLETPALIQDWAKVLMSILLKYQEVVGVGELGAMLLRLSKEIGRFRALLHDRRRTRFVAVTRGAALPRAETARLVRRLARMKVRVSAVLVNAVGRGTCARCQREAAAERREIAALTGTPAFRAIPLLLAPAELPPPHGAAGLRKWSARWMAKRAAPASTKRRGRRG
jgi:arsenite-transporting ATPase